jgi:hypothetical protein
MTALLATSASTVLAVVDPGVAPPGAAGIATNVQWVAWVVLALCVVGVLVAGGAMAVQHRRGEGGEYAAGLGLACGGAVLVGSASAFITALV